MVTSGPWGAPEGSSSPETRISWEGLLSCRSRWKSETTETRSWHALTTRKVFSDTQIGSLNAHPRGRAMCIIEVWKMDLNPTLPSFVLAGGKSNADGYGTKPLSNSKGRTLLGNACLDLARSVSFRRAASWVVTKSLRRLPPVVEDIFRRDLRARWAAFIGRRCSLRERNSTSCWLWTCLLCHERSWST